MDILVAVDRNWGIGKAGRLLVSLRTDQVRFRDLTLGQVVVYGRKTLESFPGQKPLPGRTNIIMSRNQTLSVPGAMICHSLRDLPSLVNQFETRKIWIIGGDSIYRQLLPYCRQAHITLIDAIYPADSYFPDLSLLPQWQLMEESKRQTDTDRLAADQSEVSFFYRLYEQQPEPLAGLAQNGDFDE